jgi:beta-galactosidase
LKSRTPWADAGHEVAWEQFKLPWVAPAVVASHAALPPLTVTRDAEKITIAGSGFSATFSAHTGLLVSLQSGNTELLAAPLGPHFWRAPVDNDRGNHMPDATPGKGAKIPGGMGQWRTAHESWVAKSVTVREVGAGAAIIAAQGEISALACRQEFTWTVLGSGDVLVATTWYPSVGPVPELPRFGMQTTLRAGFDQLAWLGKGPQETYWDRQDARVGLYRGKVRDQFYDYIMPQETGNKESVRWAALTDIAGRGLLAIGDPLLSVNALHYTTDDLYSASQKSNFYSYQLPVRDTITLNLDLHQRGLGGDNSWGALPHEAFRLALWPTTYRYRLHVLHGGENVAQLAHEPVVTP